MEKLKLEKIIPASAAQIYSDWLSSDGHEAITGGEADASDAVGASYTAWDGYIWGENLELDSNKRIVQSWRTSEFDDSAEDSRIEVLLESISENETKFTLIHSNIPDGDREKYSDGWEQHYFEPMLNYYTN